MNERTGTKWAKVRNEFHRTRRWFSETKFKKILHNPFVNCTLPRSNFPTPLSTFHSFVHRFVKKKGKKRKKRKKKRKRTKGNKYLFDHGENCVFAAATVHSKRSRCRILFGVYRVSVSGSVKHRRVPCRLNVCRVNMIKLMARRSCAKMDELISIEPEIVLPF